MRDILIKLTDSGAYTLAHPGAIKMLGDAAGNHVRHLLILGVPDEVDTAKVLVTVNSMVIRDRVVIPWADCGPGKIVLGSVMSLPEAESWLDRSTLRNFVGKGLPALKIGGRWMVSAEDAEWWAGQVKPRGRPKKVK